MMIFVPGMSSGVQLKSKFPNVHFYDDRFG